MSLHTISARHRSGAGVQERFRSEQQAPSAIEFCAFLRLAAVMLLVFAATTALIWLAQ